MITRDIKFSYDASKFVRNPLKAIRIFEAVQQKDHHNITVYRQRDSAIDRVAFRVFSASGTSDVDAASQIESTTDNLFIDFILLALFHGGQW